MVAQQEELGDLKLYRIPEPVTVAARSQKQVALLQREDVRVSLIYRQRLYPTNDAEGPVQRVLVTRNRTSEGLGLPLPAGRLMLFAEGAARPVLLGQATIADHAVGEEVEIPFGPAPGVRYRLTLAAPATETRREYELVVSNDRAEPVRFEAELAPQDWRLTAAARLGRRNGLSLWSVTIPANDRLALRYTLSAVRRTPAPSRK